MKQKSSSDIGGYGVQSKAGVAHDPGGAATAAAKKNGQPLGGGTASGTTGLADEAHGAEAGSVMTPRGKAKNASAHAEKGAAEKAAAARIAQGPLHNAPGSGAD